MAWMIVLGECYCCRKVFGFNPKKVPSIRIGASSTEIGRREPICRECVERANPRRKAGGLPEIVIEKDAYDPEEE